MLSPPLCGWLADGLWRGFDAGSDDLAGDGDDPGVCLGQALRAEPRALEGDPRHHDRFLRRADHGHLAGAGPGTGWRMLPQLGQGARVPEGPGQRLASDHRRPLEAESGKIVRGSTIQRLGRTVNPFAASERFTIATSTWRMIRRKPPWNCGP